MRSWLVTSKYMPEYSGSGYRAHNLYKRLSAAHPELTYDVVCGGETENTCAEYEHEGVRVRRVACKSQGGGTGRLASRWRFYKDFMAEHEAATKVFDSLPRPDLIHVFGKNNVTASAVNYALRHKIPAMIELVCDMDTPFQNIPFPARLFISNKFPSRSLVVCISKKLKDMCAACGVAEKDIWLRPNPVDEKVFFPVNEKVRHELRHANSRFNGMDKLLVYVAKFRPSKNHGFLLDVMSRLPANFKLYMKGPLVESGSLAARDNEYFASLAARAKALGLEDRVQIEKGFCENIARLYQMADVYAFPSKEEGLGTPVLESLACGVPVVGNNIRGVTDTMIIDGQNGYLSPLDVEIFASNIMRAAELSPGAMREESRKITDSAGTRIIDERYMALMRETCGLRG